MACLRSSEKCCGRAHPNLLATLLPFTVYGSLVISKHIMSCFRGRFYLTRLTHANIKMLKSDDTLLQYVVRFGGGGEIVGFGWGSYKESRP